MQEIEIIFVSATIYKILFFILSHLYSIDSQMVQTKSKEVDTRKEQRPGLRARPTLMEISATTDESLED